MANLYGKLANTFAFHKIRFFIVYIKKEVVEEISIGYKRLYSKLDAVWHFGAETTLHHIIIYKIDYMVIFENKSN